MSKASSLVEGKEGKDNRGALKLVGLRHKDVAARGVRVRPT
jgi:hypothetical protein